VNQVAGTALLHLLAVDRTAQLQVVAIVELVRGDQPRTRGTEAGQRLGKAELGRGAGHLTDPLGQILPDGEPGDVIPAVMANRAAADTSAFRAQSVKASQSS
jgi:hypothetical protein